MTEHLSRRDFIKLSGLGLALVAGLKVLKMEKETNVELPSPPSKDEMVKYLFSSSIVRSRDVALNTVPLGVNYLGVERNDSKKIIYAQVDVIPWDNPIIYENSGQNIIISPVIIPAGGDLYKPNFEYVTFGEGGSERVGYSIHNDAIVGEGSGTIAWNTVSFNLIKKLMKPNHQTKLHFATSPEGLAGILLEPNSDELNLINNYGPHTTDVLKRLKASDDNIRQNDFLGYNFWIESIH